MWGNCSKHPNTVQCLTASGPLLHIFSLGENAGIEPLSLDRPMRISERASVQGFSGAVVEAASHLPINDAKRMFGNAMSVPVVGTVVGRELLGLVRALGIETLAALFSSLSAPAHPIAMEDTERAAPHDDASLSEACNIQRVSP